MERTVLTGDEDFWNWLPDTLSIDASLIPNPTLQRLVKEVQNEAPGNPVSYNRTHNRHNRGPGRQPYYYPPEKPVEKEREEEKQEEQKTEPSPEEKKPKE